MGQRHQLFIIARLRPYGAAEDSPPLYRCVAAFHSQWLYGCLALRSARRILTLIKKKENACFTLLTVQLTMQRPRFV